MVKSNKTKLFRRNKKNKLTKKKRGGNGESNNNSPISTGSFQDMLDDVSIPMSPTNENPMSDTEILSPSPKKKILTDVERDNASNFLQRQSQNIFSPYQPIDELATIAANAIPLSPSKTRKRKSSSKKRKRKSSPPSSPSSPKTDKRKRIGIIKTDIENKIINKYKNFVPMKTLSRIPGFIEDYNEHHDVKKSQQYYDN